MDKTASDKSFLSVYMKEVNKHPLLSKLEEKELYDQYKKSSDEKIRSSIRNSIRNKLIAANLRLVVKIAFEYPARKNDILDLIQEGNIGLTKGIERFKPDLGVPLSSYIAQWIKAYMLRYIMNNSKIVKIGTTKFQRKLFFSLSKELARLEGLGIKSDVIEEEAAKQIGVPKEQVEEMVVRMGVSETLIDDGDKIEIGDHSVDIALEKEEFNIEFANKLKKFRNSLVGKKQIIFDCRTQEEPLSYKEIAEREDIKLTRQRVEQINSAIMSEFKKALESLRENI